MDPFFAKSRQAYSLFELNEFIRQVVALNFPEPLWVEAEVLQARCSRGHWYIDLVQKSEEDEEVKAQAQAVIWIGQAARIQRALGQKLEDFLLSGVQVRLLVRVEFHERYGLKLNVQDIDSAFTMGQLEQQRLQTLDRLQREGLLELNRQLALPPVLQRIAVISSRQAAGYADFRHQLERNPYGYAFDVRLFQSAVQGANVSTEFVKSMASLDPERFDCVVVIRGGGSRLDLAAFDSWEVCAAAARCPLPILVGIGHETDRTLLDYVAHTALKTPTAVAEFIIQRNAEFETAVLEMGERIRDLAREMLYETELDLNYRTQLLRSHANRVIDGKTMQLDFLESTLPEALSRFYETQLLQLQSVEQTVQAMDPRNTLKRGFAIVRKNGRAISKLGEILPGDEVEGQLSDGFFTSQVKSKRHA